MTRTFRLLSIGAAVIAMAVGATLSHAAADAEKQRIAFFEMEVQPLLQARCLKCHGDTTAKGKLRLTSRDSLLKGGDTGPVVDLQSPAKSKLLKAISYNDDNLKMPQDGKLSAKEIDVLTKWVMDGVHWTPGAASVAKQPEQPIGKITDEARKYWAYQPITKPSAPQVRERTWLRNPIDAFILAKLENKGLTPARPAERTALLRRIYYDLTGLPPTPQEVDAYLADKSPDAYEKLIDRLLASPRYGEKWGRHWLDVVRYAETNGYERDGAKPHVWRYRDYVINSFNTDKPFDRFIKEQIAGDELPDLTPEAIIATGYYRLGLWDDEPADRDQARFDEFDDIVATTSQAFLAMTMNCARCHDHKIDPIPQKDYYSLLSFFSDIPRFDLNQDTRSAVAFRDLSPPDVRASYEKELIQREAKRAELLAEMKEIEDEAIKKMPAEDQRATEGPERAAVLKRKIGRYLNADQSARYFALRNQHAALKLVPEPNRVLALSVNHCYVNPPATTVMIRGNAHSPGGTVEPNFPQILSKARAVIPAPPKGALSSGRRSVLANWIASKENPLTARVIVNRIWQHHFGRGIVPTSNDFGKFGDRPTHPELLDWLASDFMEGGWRIKRMHKLIMLSNTYQMSSSARASGLSADPGNSLLWRFNMRRLTAEEVRDSMLAVGGNLNLKMGGPSIYPKIPREVLAGQSIPGLGWGTSSPEEASRRSIYVHMKRSLLVPILGQHDQADTDSSCPVRYTTTVPTQALGLLNGDFSNEQAQALAERLRKEAPANLANQVRFAIRLTAARAPVDDEVKKDIAFINNQRSKHKLDEFDALKRYCLLLLNTNEFFYLD